MSVHQDTHIKCSWCRSSRFHVTITADYVDLECCVCHTVIVGPRPDRDSKLRWPTVNRQGEGNTGEAEAVEEA